MSEHDAEVEARKQAGLEKLLAKGFSREDLSWWPPLEEPMPPEPETPVLERRVHEYDEEVHEFKTRIETMSPKQAARAQEKQRAFEEKRRRGMWTISGEAMSRKVREGAFRIWDAVRDALVAEWPAEAARVHEAFVAFYDAPYEGPTARSKRNDEFFAFVESVAVVLPERASSILRLAKDAYMKPPAEGHKEKLLAACAAMRDGRSE